MANAQISFQGAHAVLQQLVDAGVVFDLQQARAATLLVVLKSGRRGDLLGTISLQRHACAPRLPYALQLHCGLY